jgi:bifunctional non-homologous end joining protein LigD
MTIWRPMLATAATALPTGAEWTYEVKWDGYRIIAVKDGARVSLISRNTKDLTRDYPTVVAAIARLKPAHVVLDGELVAVDLQGKPSFQALQHRATSDLALVYYAFDLLALNREPLTDRPLEARRQQLASLIPPSGVLLSEPLLGTVEHIERAVRRLGLEGVVAKRLGSRYRPGTRSDDWVKVKFSPRQDFVVGGIKPSGTSFDSLLVGYYTERGSLMFAAKVRAGFTPHLRAEVWRRLGRSRLQMCPFANLPNSVGRSRWGAGVTAEDMATLRWTPPRLVAEIAFVEWTRDTLLRHPSFVGIRDDVRPTDVRREPPSGKAPGTTR